MLKGINTVIFYVSCVALVSSCWFRNDFPADMPVDQEVLNQPKQTSVRKRAFSVSQNNVSYTIEPRYQYELSGVVVSSRYHDADYGLHKIWNDHLNAADLCVIWGVNVHVPDLNALKFWNGQFTCNYKTRDRATWEQFKENQISNNHLLSDDEVIRNTIEQVRVGDQVQLSGWLAKYSNDQGFSRDTSITRDDKGNGACETIYVEDFRIVQSMNNGWRSLLSFSIITALSTAIIWLVAVARGVW